MAQPTYPVICIPPVLQAAVPQLGPWPPLRSALALGLAGILSIWGQGDLLLWGGVAAGLGYGLWEWFQSLGIYLRLKDLPSEQQQLEYRRLLLARAQPIGGESTAFEGKFDQVIARELKQQLPSLQILSQRRVGVYTPDVIVRDPTLNLCVCVEVDEPWHIDKQTQQRAPSHWIGKDDRRDQQFVKGLWIVIRFAEEQIYQSPQACALRVAEVMQQFNPSIPIKARGSQDLRLVPRWTQAEGVKKQRGFPPSS